jgi:hypothetical protein
MKAGCVRPGFFNYGRLTSEKLSYLWVGDHVLWLDVTSYKHEFNFPKVDLVVAWRSCHIIGRNILRTPG